MVRRTHPTIVIRSYVETKRPRHSPHCPSYLSSGCRWPGERSGQPDQPAPAERYRHAIICLTDYTDFQRRLRNPAVTLYALHKRPGQDWGLYLRLWRLLRQLRPDILHTRNLAALEGQLPGFLAGIRYRIHSEHGWDVFDVDGTNPRYTRLRRLHRPLVHTYIPLSKDLERWLREHIRVAGHKIVQIYNGVDTKRFHPAVAPCTLLPADFAPPGAVVIGTVGRLQPVKDQRTLAQAFLRVLEQRPGLRPVAAGDRWRRRVTGSIAGVAGCSECVGAGVAAWQPRRYTGIDALYGFVRAALD